MLSGNRGEWSEIYVLLRLLADEKPDADFLRESEEIIARKSGLPKNSIFRYDLDK
jgi:hypothetical protein